MSNLGIPLDKLPTDRYTQMRADEVLRRMAGGESIASICSAPGMPSRGTIVSWTFSHSDFGRAFLAARAMAAECLVDDIVSIADSADDPKLAVDSRKWVASKWHRSRYGDSPAPLSADSAPAFEAAALAIKAALAGARDDMRDRIAFVDTSAIDDEQSQLLSAKLSST